MWDWIQCKHQSDCYLLLFNGQNVLHGTWRDCARYMLRHRNWT